MEMAHSQAKVRNVSLLIAGVGLVLAAAVTTVHSPTPRALGSSVSLPLIPPSNQVTKTLVIIEENHSLAQMKTGMPYLYSLALKYGYATDYTALGHPSLRNYIGIAGGQMYGITDDGLPSKHKIKGKSVFQQALDKGFTTKNYMDSMGSSRCRTTNTGPYVPRHNPWTYFVNERAKCLIYDFSSTYFAGDVAKQKLGTIGFLIPDKNHDAHDKSLAEADKWLKSRMAEVFAGPDWKSGHLAVIVTADEDDKKSDNKVLTTVIFPTLNHNVVTTPLTHYSLSKWLSQASGSAPMFNAITAPSMSDAFDLKVSP